VIIKFKIFESKNNKYPESFKKGDTIIAIEDFGGLKTGQKYTITATSNYDDHYYFDVIEGIIEFGGKNKISIDGLGSILFLPELEYNMKKYNL